MHLIFWEENCRHLFLFIDQTVILFCFILKWEGQSYWFHQKDAKANYFDNMLKKLLQNTLIIFPQNGGGIRNKLSCQFLALPRNNEFDKLFASSTNRTWEDLLIKFCAQCLFSIGGAFFENIWSESFQVKSPTYSLNIPFRKGRNVSSWSRLVSPWTITTGIRNRIVIIIYAITTTTLEIHRHKKDEEKKAQWMSARSGACSVTHSVGLTLCWMCNAVAVPRRDLNETKAEGTSWTIKSNKNCRFILNSSLKKINGRKPLSVRWCQLHGYHYGFMIHQQAYAP